MADESKMELTTALANVRDEIGRHHDEGWAWCAQVIDSAIAFVNQHRRPSPSTAPLTLDELRKMDSDMQTRRWVWIKVIATDGRHESAYYRVQSDYTHGRAFCCGWPGTGFAFEYADYGKTWLAYRCKPEED